MGSALQYPITGLREPGERLYAVSKEIGYVNRAAINAVVDYNSSKYGRLNWLDKIFGSAKDTLQGSGYRYISISDFESSKFESFPEPRDHLVWQGFPVFTRYPNKPGTFLMRAHAYCHEGDPVVPKGYLYGYLFLTEDGGNTWVKVLETSGTKISNIVLDPVTYTVYCDLPQLDLYYNSRIWKRQIVTSVAEDKSEVKVEKVEIYPQPSSDWINIQFSIATASNALIVLYDMQGKKVADIYKGAFHEGRQQIAWEDLKNVATGTYVLAIETNKYVHSTTIQVVR